MKIFVIGKQDINRRSHRTGKFVNGCVIYYTYEKEEVEGRASGSDWVPVSLYPAGGIAVGQAFELEKQYKYVSGISPTDVE